MYKPNPSSSVAHYCSRSQSGTPHSSAMTEWVLGLSCTRDSQASKAYSTVSRSKEG